MGLPCDWQINKRKITERCQYLLETGQWSDCQFIIGQEPHQQMVKGHRLFLAMSSPVFEVMFFGHMSETNDPIPIEDVQPEAFKALLKYMYTDLVEFSSFESACELLYCAKKYMLPFLVERCTEYIMSKLTPKMACRAYEFAKLFDEPVLMEQCVQIICSKTNKVLNKPSWKEIELETLLMVLEQENLTISSEAELFNAVERWAKSECIRKSLDPNDGKCLRSVVGNALSKIRFLSFTAKQFAEGPGMSPLLTKDETFAILMNLLCSENKAPMPEGFSCNTDCRGQTLTIQYNDKKKFYCLRSVTETTQCNNPYQLDSSVTFKADKNIYILGIQVPTQSRTPNCSDPTFPVTYTEVLYAYLLDSNGSRLSYTHFSMKVLSGTLVEITFDRPVFIQKHKVYCVGVIFNTPGSYPSGGCGFDTTCDTVRFLFGIGHSTDNVHEGLIRSIVFTHV